MGALCRNYKNKTRRMKKKRIVHVSTMHSSSDTRVFRNECRSLSMAGYDVIFCVPHDKEEVVDGVRIVPVPKPKSLIDRIIGAPKNAVVIAKSLNADLYHFHDPELLFPMAKLAKEGRQVIWDAHENYADTIYQFNSLKIKPFSYFGAKFFGYFELQFAVKYFKGVATITDKMAEKYRNRNIPTAVVGNFSNIDNLKEPDFEKSLTYIRFISSGMQFKERAVVEMAAAFQLLNNFEKAILEYAGKIRSLALAQEIKEQFEEERLSHLVLTGELSWSKLVNEHISNAHVAFVLFDTSDPNNCNGLPNRFFEAWSNGLPVITTAGTQVANITEEIGGGIVIPDNSPESIAKAMQFFIDEPSLAIELGKRAFSAVRERYNWKVAFNELDKLYGKILKNDA